jgi:Short-chain dehydrogenases of various substrate specificities
MELKNKKIILTGGSSGIGYQLSKKLLLEGNSLAVLARRKERLDRLTEEVKGLPGKLFVYQCDVTDKKRVNEVITEIIKEMGGIDITVLNSGIGRPEGVKKFNAENAYTVFNTNVLGIVNCIEALLPIFLEQRNGVIAGVSSLADNRGYSMSGFYCGSKAAVTMILESLSAELKMHGIKVITIKPGFVRSEMTARNDFKMPFLMDPEKAADIIVKGLKKEKRIIQFPLITVIGSKFIGLLPVRLFEYLEYKRMSKRINL